MNVNFWGAKSLTRELVSLFQVEAPAASKPSAAPAAPAEESGGGAAMEAAPVQNAAPMASAEKG
jgi:hypothetical protein